MRFWSAAPVQCIYTGLLAACSHNHPPFPLHVQKPLKYIIMPLARYAASLVGSVSHDTRVQLPHTLPHTSHAPSSIGENSQRRTLAPTQTEPDTQQATSQSTTKASSAKPPELAFSCDGAWDLDPGSMDRGCTSTRERFSFTGTINTLLNTAAGPRDPTVEGVREVVATLNR